VGLGTALCKKFEFLSLFYFICYLAPPREVGGCGPRDALGRHPSDDPRRLRPVSGPVAGADLAVCPPTASGDAVPTWLTMTFAVVCDNPESFHQIICSPKTAVVPRQGPVGAADPWQAVNNILSIPHAFVESGHSAGYEP
jgi:hypothetical protein